MSDHSDARPAEYSSLGAKMQGLKRERPSQTPSQTAAAKPWVHFVAGACGGIAVALAASPLDVLRTRLQTDFYQTQRPSSNTPLQFLRHTLQLLSSIRHTEGWRGLYRGLGPSLTGVVPASAVKFFAYGNCKRLARDTWRLDPDSPALHAMSASAAGVITGIATNPIWLVKTRLQLDKSRAGGARGQYRNSLDCVAQVLRKEGIRGLYRGLSASLLGVAETTLHLALYEQLKIRMARRETTDPNQNEIWFGVGAAAGLSKLVTALVAYPHEVIRTRLRQAPMEDGTLRYKGLIHCVRLTWQEGGLASLYGGLTPHVLRAVPSAMISLGVYELVLKLLG